MLIPKEKPPITVVGDVGGRIAIIVVRADGNFYVELKKKRKTFSGAKL